MNREELMKKLDVGRVGSGTQTYNDVVLTLTKEETLELFKYIEQLEKELKQTKLNFRNSQTHSKNCYKKLKEKYEKLERAYKNNEVMVRDLNELINRNLGLRKQIENLEEENQGVKDDNTRLWHNLECANNENAKLKQAIKILKDWFSFKVTEFYNLDGTIRYVLEYKEGLFDYGIILTEERYELLKEVLESDR